MSVFLSILMWYGIASIAAIIGLFGIVVYDYFKYGVVIYDGPAEKF
jgi:hypothetical protein